MKDLLKRLYYYLLKVDAKDVSKWILKDTGVTLKDIRGKSTQSSVVKARIDLLKALKTYTLMTNEEIMKYMRKSRNFVDQK